MNHPKIPEINLKTEIDLTTTVETTMQNLQSRFQAISDQIISKMDEMGTRIEDLENNVADLMAQAGTEEQPVSK